MRTRPSSVRLSGRGESQLRRPADLRLIASSIQFGHTYNGYESWNNRPLQKDRGSN